MAEKVSIWTKLETCIQMGILIFAVAALYYSINASNTANDIAQTNLRYSNYNMSIITFASEANLGEFNYWGNATDMFSNELSAYGNLSLSLIVITPHATVLDIGDPQKATNFIRANNSYPTGSGSSLPLLDPNQYYQSMMLVGPAAENLSGQIFPGPLPPFFQQYKDFIQPGVTQVNFTVPIFGLFYLNKQLFKSSGQADLFGFRATLASYNINVTVTDIVTQESFVKGYYGELEVWIWAHPPF